jgi:mannose-6-phosphate isomerase-like protein (cupin superfamily)
MERREFVALAGASLWGVGAGHTNVNQFPALARDAAEGDLVYVGRTRDPVRIKVSPPTGGRFGMITQDVAPGAVIPIHLHEKEDEIIFIQSGEGTATLGDHHLKLTAGSTLYVPQGTWHGGENTGTSILKWVAIYSPSGFEGYFRAIGTKAPDDPPTPRSREEFEQLDRQYGIRYRR